MHPLSTDDLLPLTCARSGSCCHGHRIGVTPWEIALLARHLGTSQAQVRDRFLEPGGSWLRFDGPADRLGRGGCAFFAAGAGCTVHPARPLACRVYPLARRRVAERFAYTFAGAANPCLSRCPEVETLPRQRLGDWLASQQVDQGETAHDAYGNLVWGLLLTAARISTAGRLDSTAIATVIAGRARLSAAERVPFLPPPWYDLLTVPELPIDPVDAAAWVDAHARRLQQAIASNFALPDSLADIVRLILTMAIHLAPGVGIDADLVAPAYAREAGMGSQPVVRSPTAPSAVPASGLAPVG